MCYWPSVSLRLHLFAPEKVWPAWAQSQIFLSVKLVFLVLSPDPLRSGQGRRHPLQHHRSRRWSAPEWDLQHRPHQWQHVCDPTPRQGGESLFPCKEEIWVSVAPFVSVSLSLRYSCAPPTPQRCSYYHTSAVCRTAISWSAFTWLSPSGLWLMLKPAMKWWIPWQSTRSLQLSFRLKFGCTIDNTDGGREGDPRWSAGKLLSLFFPSGLMSRCSCMCVCMFVCQWKYAYVCPCTCMIIAIQCILKQLEESSLSFSPSHLAPWACSDLVCPESISQLILLMLHMSNFTNTTRSNQLLYRLWLLCCCVRRDITNASQWQSFNYFWPSSTFWGL